jgi:predicted nucleic acid-binding protein
LALPPIVVTEILSDSAGAALVERQIEQLTQLDLKEGYWTRAGHARRVLHQKGLRAKVADALIAQSCIDHDIALITRDRDFRHFAQHCGLRLA